MSILDEIRKLDEQKAALLSGAKKEALQQANAAIKTLAELGYSYRLVEGAGDSSPRGTGTRRTGIRDQVLEAISASPTITRKALLVTLNVKGNRSGEQSVSNALSALKKAGTIVSKNGGYAAA